MARISSGVYTLPTSVAWVSVTRGFGVMDVLALEGDLADRFRGQLAFRVRAVSSLEPLEKNSGAPHSSVSTWAVSEQITLW